MSCHANLSLRTWLLWQKLKLATAKAQPISNLIHGFWFWSHMDVKNPFLHNQNPRFRSKGTFQYWNIAESTIFWTIDEDHRRGVKNHTCCSHPYRARLGRLMAMVLNALSAAVIYGSKYSGLGYGIYPYSLRSSAGYFSLSWQYIYSFLIESVTILKDHPWIFRDWQINVINWINDGLINLCKLGLGLMQINGGLKGPLLMTH